MLGTILIILLVLWVIGGLPHFGGVYGRPGGYGYVPSGIGLVILVLVLLWLFGGLHMSRF